MTTQNAHTRLGEGVSMITQPFRGAQTNTSCVSLGSYVKTRYGKDIDELSSRSKMLLNNTEQYITAMLSKAPTTPDEIAKQHTQFLRTLLGILGSESAEAMLLWDCIMFIAFMHRQDALSPANACRYFNRMEGDAGTKFSVLMSLIIETAPLATRAAVLKRIRMEVVTPHLENDLQRANLVAYYAANV